MGRFSGWNRVLVLVVMCGVTACGGGSGGSDVVVPDASDVSAADAVAHEVAGTTDLAADVEPELVDVSSVPDAADLSPELPKTDTGEDLSAQETVDLQGDLCGGDAGCGGCVEDGDCNPGFHCTQDECVPDKCEKGLKECANETTAVQCDEHGTELTFITCQPGQICAWGECKEKLCEPYAKWCTKDRYLAVCDGSGTGVQKVTCPAGMACFNEVCSPILHNMYVIFDTSGSMYDSNSCSPGNETFCEKPWPVCEVMEEAYSPLGISKKAFHTVFADQAAAGPLANFVLFRFPDEIDTNWPSCSTGYYDNNSEISGDDSSHITPDGPDSWFESNYHEVVSVPFPKSPGPDNLKKALEWVDFVEEFEPGGALPCDIDADCPGGGCMEVNGTKLCHFHTNPELRAKGSTPLGKTMFYAGEYARKKVILDGQLCQADEDCANSNYICGPEGTCLDPVAHCRRNSLLLFTDGNDTENSSSYDFFNPVNQAKRFHYGLGCVDEADCLAGAVCTQPQLLCMPEGLMLPSNFNDSEQGANTLKAADGSHIQFDIHVVHLGGGGGENEEIAVAGGGQFYAVDQGDLPALIEALDAIVNAKDDQLVCTPTLLPEG